MDYDNLYDFLRTESERLVRHVVPIFYMNRNRKIEFQGTATYVNVGPIKFLVTAHHVLDELFKANYVPWIMISPDHLGDIPCEEFSYSKDPQLDLAICLLKKNLELYSPYDLEESRTFESSDDFQNVLLGFPSKGVRTYEGRISAKYEGYQTQNSSITEYLRLGVDPTKFCVCDFKKERVYREKLQIDNFPDPNGMSGGPIFQFPNSKASDLRLVGIMTKWDTERKKAIIGVKIDELKKMFKITRIDIKNSSPTKFST